MEGDPRRSTVSRRGGVLQVAEPQAVSCLRAVLSDIETPTKKSRPLKALGRLTEAISMSFKLSTSPAIKGLRVNETPGIHFRQGITCADSSYAIVAIRDKEYIARLYDTTVEDTDWRRYENRDVAVIFLSEDGTTVPIQPAILALVGNRAHHLTTVARVCNVLFTEWGLLSVLPLDRRSPISRGILLERHDWLIL